MKNIELMLAQGAVSRLANKEMPTPLAESVIVIGKMIDTAIAGQNGIMEKLGLEQQKGANGQPSWTLPPEKREEFQAAVDEYKQAEVEFDDANMIPYAAIGSITPADLIALQPFISRE